MCMQYFVLKTISLSPLSFSVAAVSLFYNAFFLYTHTCECDTRRIDETGGNGGCGDDERINKQITSKGR